MADEQDLEIQDFDRLLQLRGALEYLIEVVEEHTDCSREGTQSCRMCAALQRAQEILEPAPPPLCRETEEV
jgi:hypothetical protein